MTQTTKEGREQRLADADRWDESIYGRGVVPLSARDKDFGAAMEFSRRLCRDVDALLEELEAVKGALEHIRNDAANTELDYSQQIRNLRGENARLGTALIDLRNMRGALTERQAAQNEATYKRVDEALAQE